MRYLTVRYSLTLSIVIGLILMSCDNLSTTNEYPSNPKKEEVKVKKSENDLSKDQFQKLYKKVASRYGDIKQLTVFSPDNKDKHVINITLKDKDTTLTKGVDENLNITNYPEIQSSNCDILYVGTAEDQDGNLIDIFKIQVCDDYSSGEYSTQVIPVSETIYSVSYRNDEVTFSNGTSFETEWISPNYTRWTYNNINVPSGPFTSFDQTTSTTFNDGDDGSTEVNLLSLQINKSEPGPSTPTLLSPSDGEDLFTTSVDLDWHADNADQYAVQLDDNSSFLSPNEKNPIAESEATYSGLSYDVYYWRVKARNSAGESSWSSTNNFEILPDPDMTITGTQQVYQPYQAGNYTANVTGVQSVHNNYTWEVTFYPGGYTENYYTGSSNELSLNMGRSQYDNAQIDVWVDVTNKAGEDETLAASMTTYIYVP